MKRVMLMSFVSATFVVTGCSESGDSSELEPAGQPASAERSLSEVTVVSVPNASCKLSPEGIDAPEQTADVFADYQGIVHFFANAASSSDAHPVLSVACDEEGNRIIHRIDLRDPASFSHRAVPVSQVAQRIRPALGADAAVLSQDELRRGGYPPRPDAATAPALYAEWLRAVSRPVTLVAPNVVEKPDFHAGSATSGSWAGTAMLSRPYSGIIANIPVPSIPVSPAGAAVVWAGLGGYVSGDISLIQAGTWFQATGSAAVYMIFFEYWRNAGRFITNVPIRPGDNVQTWMNPCDDNLNFSMTGKRGCFFLENTTTGVGTSTSWPANSQNTPYTGDSAEFIVEPQSSFMPNFGTMTMSALVCGLNADGSCRQAIFPGDAFDTVTMVNASGQTRVSATSTANNITAVTWRRGN